MSLSSCCRCRRDHFEFELCQAWVCRLHPHERRSSQGLQVSSILTPLLDDLPLTAPNDNAQHHKYQCTCYQPTHRYAIHCLLLFVLISDLTNFERSVLPPSFVEGW